VICNPKGLLEFDGISSKIVMYKGLFDKLGVDFQVFKAGKYKSAVEPFIQESMSAENREQITQYITSLYQYQLSEIAKNRNIPFDSLWSIAMHGSAQMPASALKLKLFDGLAYETQAKESLAKNAKLMASKAPWLSFYDYALDVDPYPYSENKIAVVYAVGDILPGKQNPDNQIGSTTFINNLKMAQNDPDIKAIVIRINSPGGSAFASDEMAHEIIACKKVKPVIISFGDVSASGGYYMGCVGDSIFALPNTITGSIGAFLGIFNMQKLFSDLGIDVDEISIGKDANFTRNPARPLSESQTRKAEAIGRQVSGLVVETKLNYYAARSAVSPKKQPYVLHTRPLPE
jgi:protease-4